MASLSPRAGTRSHGPGASATKPLTVHLQRHFWLFHVSRTTALLSTPLCGLRRGGRGAVASLRLLDPRAKGAWDTAQVAWSAARACPHPPGGQPGLGTPGRTRAVLRVFGADSFLLALVYMLVLQGQDQETHRGRGDPPGPSPQLLAGPSTCCPRQGLVPSCCPFTRSVPWFRPPAPRRPCSELRELSPGGGRRWHRDRSYPV